MYAVKSNLGYAHIPPSIKQPAKHFRHTHTHTTVSFTIGSTRFHFFHNNGVKNEYNMNACIARVVCEFLFLFFISSFQGNCKINDENTTL